MARSVEEVRREMNERKRLLAQLGSGRPEGKVNFVRNDRGVKSKVIEAVEEATTLYFHGNEDSEYTVEARSVKLMVHECKRCVIRIAAPILTHCVEVWKCENVRVDFAVAVRTLQLDLSDGIEVNFDKSEDMGTTVWTGVENLKMSFADAPQQQLSSGFSHVFETDKSIEKEVSQFYVRFVDGVVMQEKVLRLKNGFPTTKRESDSYDKEQAVAALAREAYVRGLMKFAERKIDIKDDRKAPPGGRNDPCHCGSGKKRKKCCGDWVKAPDPQPELKTLAEMQRSNAVDPAALIRRAREGDYDPKALPVDDLSIGDTRVTGFGGERAPPGTHVRVTVDGLPVGGGLATVGEDGRWLVEGIAALQLGKIVEARVWDESDAAAAAGGGDDSEDDDDPLKGVTVPKKLPLFALGEGIRK